MAVDGAVVLEGEHGLHVGGEGGVSDSGLAVRHHRLEPVQHVAAAVVGQQRREDQGERASLAVPGGYDGRPRMLLQKSSQCLSYGVVSQGLLRVFFFVDVRREALGEIGLVLEAEGLGEAQMETAHLVVDVDAGDVQVGRPVHGVEELRPPEHQEDPPRVLLLVREDESLGRFGLKELCV